MGYAYAIYLLELCLFFGLYMVPFYMDWQFQLSMYGITMVLYFIVQNVFSYRNVEKYKTLQSDPPNHDAHMVLLVVGHRENPDYWRGCLQSIHDLEPGVHAVYIVVDGTQEEDKVMHQAAIDFMKECPPPMPVKTFMVSKRGKRGAMSFGFQQIRYDLFSETEYQVDVVVTDSDTVLEPDSLRRLQECLRSDPKNGCATGSLYVFNTQTLLPRIINARYSYAFDIERSCASYFGCMSCCSGPLSIYRLEVLDDQTLQRFVTQKICGVRCEPGDDRHLTNLVLAKGYRARQTPLSRAGTEAPETLFRYILQQLRWNRSFYRELYWQIQSIPKQSLFLHFMSIYELTFPWLVLGWTLFVLFLQQSQMLLWKSIVLSFGMMVVKAVVLTIRLQQNILFYQALYYFIYFSQLLPLKMFALVTVLNSSWVTPSRNRVFRCMPSCSWDARLAVVFILLWNIAIVVGIVQTLFKAIPFRL